MATPSRSDQRCCGHMEENAAHLPCRTLNTVLLRAWRPDRDADAPHTTEPWREGRHTQMFLMILLTIRLYEWLVLKFFFFLHSLILKSPKFSSEFFACKKNKNPTLRCVNHVYTLPLKLSSVIFQTLCAVTFTHLFHNNDCVCQASKLKKHIKFHTTCALV